MTELLTSAQMRAIERAAIESGAVTGLELMERAGHGVVDAVFAEWPELSLTSHRAIVLCGPGNNGGDGFVVARLLNGWGWEVEVYLYGDPERLPPDAKANHARWCALGETIPWDDQKQRDHFEDEDTSFDLVVDALFGTGLTRPMPEDTCATWYGLMPGPLQDMRAEGAPKFVAVDIPSGICSDSGRDFGAMPAHLTVTFHRAKVGHYLSQNCENYGGAYGCGRLRVVDIGLGPTCPSDAVWKVSGARERLEKLSTGHKYSHGHALILSGGPGQTGAARLAARGALRIGAGLVTVGVPPAAQQEVASQITALMLKRVCDGAALQALLQDPRFNALCLGPGLGVERARELVPVALAAQRATVLDADALTAFTQDPEALFDMLHKDCVLTPHGGEFKRLFPDIAAKFDARPTKGPAYSKVDATREAAARADCTVLYKGADTVIAGPDGQCSISSALYDRTAPWLATAGSGDVLAGFIAGLLARGFSPIAAAEAAAWLHVECARSFGPGLIAEDMPEELPNVFRQVGVI
ncbi:NAD(P)H-hydrate dehydratase [Thalassovita taeanensis]|uniref:Bifunctional NAD(P)H-hydrate repair enzyme n=1 Tax=Thalassovita taeanensis TaxID=657014 RepID=A0A1H9HS73_9RHOB|nr:NAD(P)H-hydrate dehydratase [Thalassovita taeanensis]SEQ65098.1 yjeF C-terminal region, hydroxyethylthiazole kinase-related/yjeF N-terminal region [Thalassovita taeanensis]